MPVRIRSSGQTLALAYVFYAFLMQEIWLTPVTSKVDSFGHPFYNRQLRLASVAAKTLSFLVWDPMKKKFWLQKIILRLIEKNDPASGKNALDSVRKCFSSIKRCFGSTKKTQALRKCCFNRKICRH